MPKIFLSYRHTDTALICAEIAKILRQEFGQDHVFWDQSNLQFGRDYLQTIGAEIAEAAVVLVLIGPTWLSAENLQRLGTQEDVVRQEVMFGQQRGIPIVPLFIDRPLPAITEFPPHLQFLHTRHGLFVHSASLGQEGKNLIEAVKPYVDEGGLSQRRFGEVRCVTPPLIRIPAGQFMMGSQDRENEGPVHTVELGPFAIAKYPVTVWEYSFYLQQVPEAWPPITRTINWLQQLKHPVVNIPLIEAFNYASWLARVTGQPWRLLTEAEWEKAAGWDEAQRSMRRYPWGKEFSAAKCVTAESQPHQPIEVGKLPAGASPYGVLDLAGNVWEWTISPAIAYPFNPQAAMTHAAPAYVARGGSWRHPGSDAQVARRMGQSPGYYDNATGFRLGFSTQG